MPISAKDIPNRLARHLAEIIDDAPVRPQDKFRLQYFTVIVFLGVFIMIGFGVYNIVTGNFLLTSLIFFSGTSLIFGWLLTRFLPVGQFVFRMNALFFGSLALYMLVLGGKDGSKSLWIFSFPFLTVFLMGKIEGFVWSGGLFAAAMALLLVPLPGLVPYHYSPEFLIRLASVYLVLSVLTYWSEFLREHYALNLECERQRLHEANTALQDFEARHIRCTQAFTALTGLTAEQLLGNAVQTIRPPDSAAHNGHSEPVEHEAHQQLLAVLDSIEAQVYAVDVYTYKILYMNPKMKAAFGSSSQENRLCWQICRGASKPCDHCAIPALLAQEPEPIKLVARQERHPLSQQWQLNFDRLIPWPGQRSAKMQFTFDINKFKQMEAEFQAPEARLSPPPKPPSAVLLVDDDQMLRDMGSVMLSDFGFTVLAAADGVEAVELFRRQREDILLVLCDLFMPRMNGWETLSSLRAIDPDIRVIIISGQDQFMDNGHPDQPQAFLTKPYTISLLRNTICQVLGETAPDCITQQPQRVLSVL